MRLFRSWLKKNSLFPLCLLAALLVACGTTPLPANQGSWQIKVTSKSSEQTTTPTVGSPGAMPQTSTSCPQPALSGRAPVMRPLALGKDPAVAYINDQGVANAPGSFAELKLYDTVKGAPLPGVKGVGGKSVIVHLAGAHITEAQISNDGQWLLFVTELAGSSEIQMVRVDGQGLQTLYCAPPGTVKSLQWSPDHSRFIFSQAAVSGLWNLYLFTMNTGAIQRELVQMNSASTGFLARTWLDDRRVYVVGVVNTYPKPSAPSGLFILDTGKGPDQKASDLSPVLRPGQSQGCWSFDSDYGSAVLIASQCKQTPGSAPSNGYPGLTGPSTITAMSVTGSSPRIISSDRQHAVGEVRMFGHSSTSLLVAINTLNPNNPLNPANGLNGLWKMNISGGGLTLLSSSDSFSESEFNQFSQYPWSNLSLDSSMYAIAVQAVLSKSNETTLEVGPLNGGPSIPFDNGSANLGMLAIAGWTSV